MFAARLNPKWNPLLAAARYAIADGTRFVHIE
jgi:hypothetical protein